MEDQNKNNPANKAIISIFNRLNSIVNPIDRLLLKTPLKNIEVTQRRFIILFMSFFAIFIFLLTIIGLVFQALNKPATAPNTLAPARVEKPSQTDTQIKNPSVYANDPEILNLSVKVNEVQKSLDTYNAFDTRLNPPSLNYEIEF